MGSANLGIREFKLGTRIILFIFFAYRYSIIVVHVIAFSGRSNYLMKYCYMI